MSKTMAFSKQHSGEYFATDDTYQYAICRDGKYWLLQVRELTTTAGVRHAIGQSVIDETYGDTKRDLVAVASHYSAFGDTYRQSEHGHCGRMTAAISDAYDEMG